MIRFKVCKCELYSTNTIYEYNYNINRNNQSAVTAQANTKIQVFTAFCNSQECLAAPVEPRTSTSYNIFT